MKSVINGNMASNRKLFNKTMKALKNDEVCARFVSALFQSVEYYESIIAMTEAAFGADKMAEIAETWLRFKMSEARERFES